jgi:hypothetical protein
MASPSETNAAGQLRTRVDAVAQVARSASFDSSMSRRLAPIGSEYTESGQWATRLPALLREC